jgi:hypothetical protein
MTEASRPEKQSGFLDEAISVAMSKAFRDAVKRAAKKRGVTLSEYGRQALAAQMDADKVRHPRLAVISRPAR